MSEELCEKWGGLEICVGDWVKIITSWRPAVIVEGRVVNLTKTNIVVDNDGEYYSIPWREVKMLSLRPSPRRYVRVSSSDRTATTHQGRGEGQA